MNNLAELHDAIIEGLRRKLAPIPATVEAYPDIDRAIALPAVLVELSEMEPGTDPGTGETALIGRFQARAVVDPNATDAMLQVRELAARVAIALTHENFGLPIEIAKLTQIGEDAFKPELDGYKVWLVEWTHEFHLGETDWPWADDTGKTLLVAFNHETGQTENYAPIPQEPA